MKLKIKQNILLEQLNYVIKGISNKNLIPILNCIKLELTSDGLYLLSTDNEIAIKAFIDKKDIEEIEEQGELVISGRYLYEIIRKLDKDIINIEEVVDSQVLITTKSSEFKLNCNNVSEFPEIDLTFTEKPIIIDSDVLKTTISQTLLATSLQESRPILTGLNFKIQKDILEVTGTDSYRLSKKRIKLSDTSKEDIDIVVPYKTLSELPKIISSDEKI